MNERDERDIVDLLNDLLTDPSIYADEELHSCQRFEEAQLMTNNNGLVVRFNDGTEFQLTVVKVARSTNGEVA